ncbi:MAG TPA: hypothetical protein VGQ59_09260 [Cyclobacteriaceae bacterium]|jgi:5-hydroxyisourate hydrolase-like protein (transthyretin family)|nr:hypothetical protein [Cyclobacteriaceae bacterium]
MKSNKLLIFIVLSLPIFQLNGWGYTHGQDDCEKIKVSIVASDTSDGKPNGKIEIAFEKQSKFSAYLFSSDPTENQLEVKERIIENLKRGTYNLYIQVEKKCTKHFIVEIN